MGCRSQKPRFCCAPGERQNEANPLFLHGPVFLYHMSPSIPARRCEDTPAFSAQGRHERFYIQVSLPLSRIRLDMAPMVRESVRLGA